MIVTNIQLFGFGFTESQNCKFCNKAPETLSSSFLHMFCCCYILGKCFRLHFQLFKNSFSFNNFNKVFGISKINNNEHNIYLLNCLLLRAKFVRYRCKYANRIPTTLEFYQQVQKVKKRRNTFYRKTVVKLIFSEKNDQCYSEFIKNRSV